MTEHYQRTGVPLEELPFRTLVDLSHLCRPSPLPVRVVSEPSSVRVKFGVRSGGVHPVRSAGHSSGEVDSSEVYCGGHGPLVDGDTGVVDRVGVPLVDNFEVDGMLLRSGVPVPTQTKWRRRGLGSQVRR